jgi:hypothetical protein
LVGWFVCVLLANLRLNIQALNVNIQPTTINL